MRLKENITGKETAFITDVNVSVKDNVLVFAFDSKNSTFNSYSDKYNDELFRGDAVEVFLSIGEKDHYYEIEVAPNNTLFVGDIYNDGVNRKLTMLENTFVSNVTSIYANNYRTTIAFDLNKLGVTDLSKIEFNCFRIETEGVCSDKNLICLNPTLCGTFHKREYFLKLSEILK